MNFRNWRLSLGLGLGLVLGAVGLALGQGAGLYQIISPTGTEQVLVNNPSSAYNNSVALNAIRNTTGYQLSSATSGTVTMTTAADNLIFTAVVSGATTANLPPSPPDGSLASIVNGSGSAFTGTITVATTDSSTIVGGSSLATLASAASAEYQYVASATKWYRMR